MSINTIIEMRVGQFYHIHKIFFVKKAPIRVLFINHHLRLAIKTSLVLIHRNRQVIFVHLSKIIQLRKQSLQQLHQALQQA